MITLAPISGSPELSSEMVPVKFFCASKTEKSNGNTLRVLIMLYPIRKKGQLIKVALFIEINYLSLNDKFILRFCST